MSFYTLNGDKISANGSRFGDVPGGHVPSGQVRLCERRTKPMLGAVPFRKLRLPLLS
jgi:hypothetical protein